MKFPNPHYPNLRYPNRHYWYVPILSAVLLLLNGGVNLALMRPLTDVPASIDQLRFHLDDAVFSLFFLLTAAVFAGAFSVLRRERGYLYLSFFSLMASQQFFWEWDGKSLLFGDFPVLPAESLAVKSGMTFAALLFFRYLQGTDRRLTDRTFIYSAGGVWAMSVISSISPLASPLLPFLSGALLAIVLAYLLLAAGRFVHRFRRYPEDSELHLIVNGFAVFAILIIPDVGKDVLQVLTGQRLGYLPVFWEACLEDTFPWALMQLIFVFGLLFFRRYMKVLEQNREAHAEIRAQHESLKQEVAIRQHMDRLLDALSGSYRLKDLEHTLVAEGRRLFEPHPFHWIPYNRKARSIDNSIDNPGLDSGELRELEELLFAADHGLVPGEILPGSKFAPVFIGVMGREELYAAISPKGRPLLERERFALQLLAKYGALFLDYYAMMEKRISELERYHGEQPWVGKLFMQMAEKERKRLASDLHDEVLQELLAARRWLEGSGSADDPNTAPERMRLALENAEFMIRETCAELMPSFLSEHGVIHAVLKLVDKMRVRADFQLEVRTGTLAAKLDDDLSLTVYRIVQELLNNAWKHSGAARVRLDMEQEAGEIVIRYADDGKGMDAEAAGMSPDRFGLRGLNERVRLMGGSASIDTRPDEGFRAECRLPLKRPATAPA